MRPEIVIAVDWSGSVRGVRRSLWIAEARVRRGDRRLSRLECGRNREETVAHLIALASREPRLVVGLDFAFSFPAWFLRENGIATAGEAWQLARREGESWLARCEPPFWGKPGRRRPPILAGRSPFRLTEGERTPIAGVGPKSVFQIAGAGSVGTGSIRGMPALERLRLAGFSICPFDPPRLPMAIEIYPRWLTGRVRKTNEVARRLFLARSAVGQDRGLVEIAAESEDAFDAAASALVMASRASWLLEIAADPEPEHRLEGRIWNPPPEIEAVERA